MRRNVFVECNRSLTEDDVTALERVAGMRLPESVRCHYLRHNGGRPRRSFFRTADGREYGVAWFYPVKHRGESGEPLLEEVIESMRSRAGVEPSMIPVAHDDGGADFCIRVDDGSVWFINSHSDSVTPRWVASSLDGFIGGMLTARDFYLGRVSSES